MSIKNLIACTLFATAAACASSRPVAGAGDEAAPRANRDRNLITAADLDADPSLKASTVLDVIRSLRPQFLNNRGTQTIVDSQAATSADPEAGNVHASVNAGRVTSIAELSQIHGNDVIEIRLLTVPQAMQKFGQAARQGPVILVTTAKQ